MRKVIPYNENLQKNVIPTLRMAFYGVSANAQEYRDSYVINEAIDRFKTEDVSELMNEKITEFERQEKKLSKTVNFRADCYLKLNSLSASLGISTAEACRRLLYHSAYNIENTIPNNHSSSQELTQLKAKMLLLESHVNNLERQILLTKEAFNEITTEIIKLEKGGATNVN